jgi:hypothetical protein
MKIVKNIAICALIFTPITNLWGAYTISKKIGSVDTKVKIYGFAQYEAKGGDGAIKDKQDASVKFGAQRVRFGINYSAGSIRGKLFLDFNKAHDDKSGVGLPDMVKDAFAGYFVDNSLFIKAGLMKMPHGMGFTTPGWNLDVAQRAFDKALAAERGMGVMISGRNIGYNSSAKVNGFEMGHERAWKGFGYDFMIANQAGRSGAVINANPGDANAYAARVMFDWTEQLHVETSYLVSEKAGGLDRDDEDYKSFNFGIDSHFGRANGKLEIFSSQNLQGVKGWDENTYSITGTYYLTPTIEAAIKHIQGSAEKDSVKTDLGNTYIGINYYIDPFDSKMDRSSKKRRNAHRVQLNYVLTSGDTDSWNGLKGYTDNLWLIQYQYKF